MVGYVKQIGFQSSSKYAKIFCMFTDSVRKWVLYYIWLHYRQC